jgi:hypothetical protein
VWIAGHVLMLLFITDERNHVPSDSRSCPLRTCLLTSAGPRRSFLSRSDHGETAVTDASVTPQVEVIIYSATWQDSRHSCTVAG